MVQFLSFISACPKSGSQICNCLLRSLIYILNARWNYVTRFNPDEIPLAERSNRSDVGRWTPPENERAAASGVCNGDKWRVGELDSATNRLVAESHCRPLHVSSSLSLFAAGNPIGSRSAFEDSEYTRDAAAARRPIRFFMTSCACSALNNRKRVRVRDSWDKRFCTIVIHHSYPNC